MEAGKDFIKRKLLLKLLSFLGPTGVIFIFVVMVLAITIAANNEASTSNAGVVCSTTGTLNTELVDTVLSKAGAFAGKREAFETVAKKYNIDPILMIAISIHETGWGKSQAVMLHNNPSGQMSANGLIHFDTLEEGLEMTGKTLNNLVNTRKLNTIEKLQTAYAPTGAANDPNGLNNHWVKNVTGFVKELGGLTLECKESEAGTGIIGGTSNEKSKKALEWALALHEKGVIYTQGGSRGTFPYYDCSAFVTLAMREAGINIGLGSTETLYQVEGTLLEPISRSEVKAGDIFVWGVKGGSGGDYGHTGFFLDDGGKTILHCTPATTNGFAQKGDVVVTPFEGYYGSPIRPVYFYRFK